MFAKQKKKYASDYTTNVPCHLPNKLEYKCLGCIPVHYQSRMTSNGIAITPSRSHSAPPKHKGALFRPLVVTMQAGAGREHGSAHVHWQFVRADRTSESETRTSPARLLLLPTDGVRMVRGPTRHSLSTTLRSLPTVSCVAPPAV